MAHCLLTGKNRGRILPLTGKKELMMTNIMTTKLSSKGQVVLPEALRNMYGWDAGTAFTVLVYQKNRYLSDSGVK